MSSRPNRDLRLERLGERDGLRRYYGEIGQVAPDHTSQTDVRQSQATLEALIDAVFTAPGVAEWLNKLKLAVAAKLAENAVNPREAPRPETLQMPQPRT